MGSRFRNVFLKQSWPIFGCVSGVFLNMFRHEFLQGGKDATLRKRRPCRVDLRFTDGIGWHYQRKIFLLKKKVPKIGLAKYAFLGYMLDNMLVTFQTHLPPKTSKKSF